MRLKTLTLLLLPIALTACSSEARENLKSGTELMVDSRNLVKEKDPEYHYNLAMRDNDTDVEKYAELMKELDEKCYEDYEDIGMMAMVLNKTFTKAGFPGSDYEALETLNEKADDVKADGNTVCFDILMFFVDGMNEE